MYKLCADFDRLIQHLPHKIRHLRAVGIGCLNQHFEQVQRVPSVPLHVSCQRFDGRTGTSNILNSDDLPARKIDEVECVGGKRQQCVKQAQLILDVRPKRPKAGDCVMLLIARRVHQDSDQQLEGSRVDTLPVGYSECLNRSCPVEAIILQEEKIYCQQRSVLITVICLRSC